MWLIIGFVGGLVVGWFFFPRPQWAQEIGARIIDYFRTGS